MFKWDLYERKIKICFEQSCSHRFNLISVGENFWLEQIWGTEHRGTGAECMCMLKPKFIITEQLIYSTGCLSAWVYMCYSDGYISGCEYVCVSA